jgi:phospholipid-binding lipoprotein MlaA
MSNLAIAAAALLSGTSVSPQAQNGVSASIEVAAVHSESATLPVSAPDPQPVAPVTAPVDPNANVVSSPEAPPPPENEIGTIVVTGRNGPPPGDPVEAVNEVSFVAVQAVDTAIIEPVTRGYDKVAPSPIKKGLYNALNNLNEPIVFLNFLLQLKIGKAAETVGRFAVNSTVGLAGVMDVAKKKPFHLPRRSNGFADTMGYYGIGSGPYLFLPAIGSTSVRDLLGRFVDLSVLPIGVGKPFSEPLVSLGKGIASSLDDRLRNDEIVARVQKSDRPYAAMREYYLKKREAQIDVLKGKRCNALLGLDELELIYKGDLSPPGTAPRKVDGIRIILPAQKPACPDEASAEATP